MMKPKIVVVEDNIAVGTALADLLSKHNFEAFVARDGFAALDLVHRVQPDLIISDIMMRGINGYEFLARLRGDTRTEFIPLILLTARADVDSKLKGLELGADAYLTKPYEFKELYLKIINIIEMQEKITAHALREKYSEFESEQDLFISKIEQILDDNLVNQHFRTEDLAAEMNMSLSTLQRKVRLYTELSPNNFINRHKLTKARIMIRSRFGNLSEIAYLCGFKSLSYFSFCYKKHYGKPPSEDK
ncbi:MAG: response regulator [Bacteroidota bacterium]